MNTAYIERIEDFKGSATKLITLNVPPPFTFVAGQYIYVELSAQHRIPLSIASAPQTLPRLELHYQSTPGDPLAQAMDERLTECLSTIKEGPGKPIILSEPNGEVICPSNQHSLLLIVGGTGASQAFSCAEHRSYLAGPNPNTIESTTILWCADRASDLYHLDRLASLRNTTVHTTVDSTRTYDNQGLVWLREFHTGHLDTEQTIDHYIVSGSPGFVYAVVDQLTDIGVPSSRIASDVFAYAPRTATPDV